VTADILGHGKQRYGGILDRLTLYTPFEPGQDTEKWKALVKTLSKVPSVKIVSLKPLT